METPSVATWIRSAGQNLLLQSLPEPVFESLRPRMRRMDFHTGDVLFAAGDTISAIYFMYTGAVSLVVELSSGEMIESAMVGRDSVVGGAAALDGRHTVYKAIVQVPGTGVSLDIDAARHMAQESMAFRAAIFRHEQMILAQAQQSAACNATHNLSERLARWLLRVRDVTGSDTFQLTQEFIAEMLGVGRTSVSIVAHTLQQAGMISYSRGHIRIVNLDALRDAACECYGAVKHHYDRLMQSPRA